ncbi:hypothetical protein CHS0354_000536 [Potamilus streckersoni]|uniref:Transposase n=1 Tax=Potamilus streckersoni TaxID=2493646 RepID=A0AAE0W7E7_9BIVA|nr:hypothetical protein CHS0354_000536 [Potamilus streckersoni]
MKFANPTNDVAFRKVFGNKKKLALISFLNAVIKLPSRKPITKVTLLNPYQLPKLSGGKSTIVDVKATDGEGNNYLVEMQVTEATDFEKRIQYYVAQSYAGQIVQGNKYQKLKPIYFIGILKFNIGKNPNYFTKHRVHDVETQENVLKEMEFNFIQLKRFKKKIEDLITPIDQWAYFLKNAEDLEIIPKNVKDKGLKAAYLEADRHNWTKDEAEYYLKAEIKERDELGALELAEKRGEEKGIGIGIGIGEEKGRVEGIEIGEERMVEKIILSKHPKFSVAQLAELTDLTEDEVIAILKKHDKM